MSATSKRLVVLHGANLDLLGARPAEHYGTITLPELESLIESEAKGFGWECLFRQTNHEGSYIEFLHEYRCEGAMIVNPGAWTHYSYAIRDAVELVDCPVAEVHLSAIADREVWRRHSVISQVVSFTISGKGPEGYVEALRRLVQLDSAEDD
jgi:3-dehydroquinate dehydratase-2